ALSTNISSRSRQTSGKSELWRIPATQKAKIDGSLGRGDQPLGSCFLICAYCNGIVPSGTTYKGRGALRRTGQRLDRQNNYASACTTPAAPANPAGTPSPSPPRGANRRGR